MDYYEAKIFTLPQVLKTSFKETVIIPIFEDRVNMKQNKIKMILHSNYMVLSEYSYVTCYL